MKHANFYADCGLPDKEQYPAQEVQLPLYITTIAGDDPTITAEEVAEDVLECVKSEMPWLYARLMGVEP